MHNFYVNLPFFRSTTKCCKRMCRCELGRLAAALSHDLEQCWVQEKIRWPRSQVHYHSRRKSRGKRILLGWSILFPYGQTTFWQLQSEKCQISTTWRRSYTAFWTICNYWSYPNDRNFRIFSETVKPRFRTAFIFVLQIFVRHPIVRLWICITSPSLFRRIGKGCDQTSSRPWSRPCKGYESGL